MMHLQVKGTVGQLAPPCVSSQHLIAKHLEQPTQTPPNHDERFDQVVFKGSGRLKMIAITTEQVVIVSLGFGALNNLV
jgi:hypothetical protein